MFVGFPMYFVTLYGLKSPLYAIHKYVCKTPTEYSNMAMPPIIQPNNNPFITVPSTTSGKPFVATNKTGRASSQLFNEEMQDDVTKNLEGFTPIHRGSRKKPSVLKYPVEIGSGQVPHAMQFKVFWRWENKDLVETLNAAKVETEKKLGKLASLSSLIQSGNISPENLARSPLSDEGIAALRDLTQDTDLLKLVDPSLTNDNLAVMLDSNPSMAKQVLEQTISSYQTRLSDITTELSNGSGKVGLDEQERLLVQGRLSENINASTAVGAATTGAGVAGLAGIAYGFARNGLKGAVTDGLIGAAGGAAAALALQQGAKLLQNQAVYDQMVSIYLPFCTKINNEDMFQYEDPSQAAAGAVFDGLGNPLDTAEQGAQVGVNMLGDAAGMGGAGAITQGRVVNPRLEKLFKQKDFRSFNFSWEFYPKTKQEVDIIRDIIETFRYHSHPARENKPGSDDASAVAINLRVPGEFEIRFLSSNPNQEQQGFVENEYLPKIGRCAINQISVDYSPNSIYSSFTDNSPTAITFSISVSEMGLLTRELIDKGY